MQGEPRGDKGRQGEIRGGKTSGRRTHHPTQAHRHTCGETRETRGDKGRQGETRGDKGRQGETRGDKGRQRETREDKGRQGETRPRVGGHTIQHQGGHLKKALRNPNSTLLGEKSGRSFSSALKSFALGFPSPLPLAPVDQTARRDLCLYGLHHRHRQRTEMRHSVSAPSPWKQKGSIGIPEFHHISTWSFRIITSNRIKPENWFQVF